MTSLRLNLLALVALVIATSAHAERPTTQGDDEAALRALSPAQINAIRAVSRNVLAAKKSGAEDSADAGQLVRLRASLDRLIAADLDPKNRMPITVQGEERAEQRQSRLAIADLREAARTDARALAGQMRQHGGLMAARAQANPAADTTSAGFPVGEQRARLFERWAQKLDTALADGNLDRAAQLRELRDQLQLAPGQATKGGLTDAPLAHGTPTLQAMPAGFVPPERAAYPPGDNNNPAANE